MCFFVPLAQHGQKSTLGDIILKGENNPFCLSNFWHSFPCIVNNILQIGCTQGYEHLFLYNVACYWIQSSNQLPPHSLQLMISDRSRAWGKQSWLSHQGYYIDISCIWQLIFLHHYELCGVHLQMTDFPTTWKSSTKLANEKLINTKSCYSSIP